MFLVVVVLSAVILSSVESQPPPTTLPLKKGVCILRGSSNIRGTIYLTEKPGEDITLTGRLEGLPTGLHGFHVHQYGDLTNGCPSTGGHYNPLKNVHGGKYAIIRHVGDLGSIVVDQSETYHLDMRDTLAKLTGPNSVYGRAIVIHAKADDLGRGGDEGSLKTGNAGGRLACCIIAVAK